MDRKDTDGKRKKSNKREMIIFSLMAVMFLVVISLSLSTISSIRINGGDSSVQSDKDLTCYFTINSNSEVNVTWYRNGAQNLTTSLNCNSGVECHTSIGQGTIPNLFTSRDDLWNCTIRFDNGTGIESSGVSVTVIDSPPTQPRIYYSNGTEISNSTINILQDASISLIVNSTDADGDSITYNMNDTTYCSINAGSGSLTCNPTSLAHTGLRTMRIGADTFYASAYQYQQFNVSPIPKFVPPLIAKNITLGQAFNYLITGEDSPSRYPLGVTIVNVSPFLNLTLSTIDSTTFMLMLYNNHTATYAETKNKNYSVTLRINDTDTSGNSRNTTVSFNITGITYNQLPNISYRVYNSASLVQGGNLSVYINATDLDNNILTFSSNDLKYPVIYNSSTNYNSTVADASFAYAWVNVTGLTNDQVIDNTFTIYAFDGNENSLQEITLSIANINDAPVMHEMSYSATNTLSNNNLSNLTAYTGVPFRFQINSTDIDDLTYDAASTGIGVYSTNDSNFAIGSSNGLLSFTPSTAGNFTFNVTVTDFGGLRSSRIARIEINSNTNPVFNINPINITCYERDQYNWNFSCYYNISLNVTEVDSGDYISNFWTNSTIFTINSLTGVIHFNATQAMVGNYSILLNATDSRGGLSNAMINMYILNTNNPPSLDEPSMPPQTNLLVGTPYQITYGASDLDLNLANTYENLTFNYSITGPVPDVSELFILTKTTSTLATLAINPVGYSYDGNYSINVTVTDYYGNKSSRHMYLYIYNVTANPTISQIIPSGTPFNSTINNASWVNAGDFPNMTTTINIYENKTYLFNQTSSADSSSYPNSLTYTWYYDGTLITNASYYQRTFDFFSNGSHTLVFTATDRFMSSRNFTWQINVTNVIRRPVYFNGSLENLTIPGSGFIPEYLTYSDGRTRFYSPDDDPSNSGHNTDDTTNLVFSSTGCAYANISFEYHRLNVNAIEVGECLVIFTATHPLNNSLSVSSEIIRINITNVTSNPIVVPVQVPIRVSSSGGTSSTPTPIPYPQEVEVPRPLQILTPKLVTTYQNATIKVPVIINNTWNNTIIGITLEAETNADNVSLYMDRIYIPKMDKGESIETTLYVKNYKSEGHYEINIYANLSEPQYRDTATIYINSAEMNSEGDELQSKISFARDLLSSNPECAELNELLLQAKKELASGNYVSTSKIINNVINGCKYLVNNAKKNTEAPSGQFVKTFEWKKSYNDYAIIGLFALLFIISLFYILKKDRPEEDI